MNHTTLRYFLGVVRHGSVTTASEQLNVAASAISRQIASLEAELDCVLFERRPRGMVPSPAGMRLAEHARRMLLEAEEVAREIRNLRGAMRGLLRLSSSDGFSLDLLPRAVASFRQQHPGVRFDLSVQPPAVVSTRVREGLADIGLTFTLTPSTGVAVAHRSSVDMLAVCRPDHPIAALADVSLAELSRHELVLPAQNTTARQVFDAACAVEGVAVEPGLTANALTSLVRYVLMSGAVCILSELSERSRLADGTLAAVPIRTAGSLTRTIEIQAMVGRRLPETAARFIEHLVRLLEPSVPD